MEIEDLKYPIGRFTPKPNFSLEDIQNDIKEIEYFPSALRAIVSNLNEKELEWQYRPNGWNILQVVHHCADSHINAFCRYKLTLSEDTPEIRPYMEDRWAMLSDYQTPPSFSLDLLENLHIKWTYLLRGLNPDEFQRNYFHPEMQQKFNLYYTTMQYAWHGNHHLAHIKHALESKGVYN